MWLVLLLILAVLSCWDLRMKQLPVRWLYSGVLISIGVALFRGWQVQNIWSIFSGMLPGVILMLLARVLQGKIGSGDGLVLLIVGNMLGMKKCLCILLLALLLSFFYSCVLLICFRKNKEYSFPFVPFLFGAAVLVFGLKGV